MHHFSLTFYMLYTYIGNYTWGTSPKQTLHPHVGTPTRGNLSRVSTESQSTVQNPTQ